MREITLYEMLPEYVSGSAENYLNLKEKIFIGTDLCPMAPKHSIMIIFKISHVRLFFAVNP